MAGGARAARQERPAWAPAAVGCDDPPVGLLEGVPGCERAPISWGSAGAQPLPSSNARSALPCKRVTRRRLRRVPAASPARGATGPVWVGGPTLHPSGQRRPHAACNTGRVAVFLRGAAGQGLAGGRLSGGAAGVLLGKGVFARCWAHIHKAPC